MSEHCGQVVGRMICVAYRHEGPDHMLVSGDSVSGRMIMRNKARDQKLRERLGEAVLAEVVTYIDAELESLNVTQSSGSLTEDVSGSDGAVPNPGAPEGSD